MQRPIAPLVTLVLTSFVACKEPVEDRVAPPPAAPQKPTRPVTRGVPPPEAKAYVLAAPPVQLRFPVKASFEGQIALLGYDVPKTRFRPGEPVAITMYWKALTDVADNWQIFMHLDPEGVDDGVARGFGDHYPVFGLYPTHAWKAGQVVRDQVTLTLAPNMNKAKAEVWVGLYIGDRRAKLAGDPNDGKHRFKMAVFDVDLGLAAPAITAPAGPRTHRVFRTTEKIIVDGKLDEPAWQKIASTGRFARTTGGNAKSQTWAKMLWDDEHLYIAFHCSDSDIRSPYTKRDDPLWQTDAVEVFLDPSGKGENYYELQVSPANVIFDAFFPRRRPPPDRGGDLGYTANLKTGVFVDGTLNRPGDTDKSWVAEMAIPFKDIRFAPNTPPKEGDVWRANFIRVERTSGEFDDSAWSPPGNDYHNLSQMGTLVFAGVPGAARPIDPRAKLRLPPSALKNLRPLGERLRLRPKLTRGSADAGPPTILPAP
jgi:hypothetical protein